MIKVALLGRPNVGKSTLFNRLAQRKIAIVHDTPGVTRDYKETKCSLYDINFMLYDTPGIVSKPKDELEQSMNDRTIAALNEADIILWVFDGQDSELSPEDKEVAEFVRNYFKKHKINKPVQLVLNKCERPSKLLVNRLGFGESIMISAEHGLGLNDLYDVIEDHLEKLGFKKEDPIAKDFEESSHDMLSEEEFSINSPIRLSIIGRPNVGKSTLMNSLLGYARVLTGPTAGLTRDAIEVEWEYNGRKMILTDTAGQRKRSNVNESLEIISNQEARKSVQYSNGCVLVVDANNPLEKQDMILASKALEEGRFLVIAINKWDTIKSHKKGLDANSVREEIEHKIRRLFPHGLPFVTISALNNDGLDKLLSSVLKMYDNWTTRIPTSPLNRWLQEAIDRNPPPIAKEGRRPKIKYATQIKTRPPTFALFLTQKLAIRENYLQYLMQDMRKTFKIEGVPIRFVLREQKNPYT